MQRVLHSKKAGYKPAFVNILLVAHIHSDIFRFLVRSNRTVNKVYYERVTVIRKLLLTLILCPVAMCSSYIQENDPIARFCHKIKAITAEFSLH